MGQKQIQQKQSVHMAGDDTCKSVKCGGHLQWINTVDRLGSLCLECAIGTHS